MTTKELELKANEIRQAIVSNRMVRDVSGLAGVKLDK